MIESNDYFDEQRKIKIISLYGKKREPAKEDLEDIDVVCIDLFDIGTRYYTYIWTMALIIKKCEEYNIPVVILDRPNPINGITIEGNLQNENYLSFVGLYLIPVRHSLTIGEVANYLKNQYFKRVNLTIIKMKNYERKKFYPDFNLYWHYPSPNMPNFLTALNYPGLCLLEATNISEGRGTTCPFEIFGAPFIIAEQLCEKLNKIKLPAVYFRPIYFSPTFDKFKNQICGGAYIHITDYYKYKPYLTGIVIINEIKRLYPDNFEWYKGPYEYEYEKLAIDILTGSDEIRKIIEKGEQINIKKLNEFLERDNEKFLKNKKEIILYK